MPFVWILRAVKWTSWIVSSASINKLIDQYIENIISFNGPNFELIAALIPQEMPRTQRPLHSRRNIVNKCIQPPRFWVTLTTGSCLPISQITRNNWSPTNLILYACHRTFVIDHSKLKGLNTLRLYCFLLSDTTSNPLSCNSLRDLNKWLNKRLIFDVDVNTKGVSDSTDSLVGCIGSWWNLGVVSWVSCADGSEGFPPGDIDYYSPWGNKVVWDDSILLDSITVSCQPCFHRFVRFCCLVCLAG